MKENAESIHQSIVDLYMQVKIRTQDEIENFNKDKEGFEKDKLLKTSPLLLLDYIRSSIEIIISLKVQEQLELNKVKSSTELNGLSTNDDETPNEYEKLLRQLEGEIRNHIKIEHQMKLHNESLQCRIEELEGINDKIKNKYKAMKEKRINNEKQENNIESLKNEITFLKGKIQSEDKMNLEFEKKVKILTLNFEIEIRKLEEKYNENLRGLNQKILEYQELLKEVDKKSIPNHKKEEKKILNRNNSASYIERKEIRLFKTDLKSQDFFKSRLEKEVGDNISINTNIIPKTHRKENEITALNINNISKNTFNRQINSHRAKTIEKTSGISVSNSTNFNKNNNVNVLLNSVSVLNGNKSSNNYNQSANSFSKGSLPNDFFIKINQNGFKSNEINLKQFIYNKASKAKSLSKITNFQVKNKV